MVAASETNGSAEEQAASLIESGDPSENPRHFRGCLAQYATGVTVITTKFGDGFAGVTANSFSSLSLDPPLILWSIARSSRSFDAFNNATHFAINVLGADQISVSQHFSSKEEDKFAGASWRLGRDGVPLIEGAIATLECSVENIHDGGDHVLIVGRVGHYAWYTGEPLLFVQGRYSIADEHPDYSEKRSAEEVSETAPLSEQPILSLLFRVYHHMSANFEEHRKAEGATVQQGRTMAALYAFPGLDIPNLIEKTYMGQRDVEDAIAELKERGLVVENMSKGLELTKEGVKTRLAISRRWSEFQKEILKPVPVKDLETARSVLTKLIDASTH